MSDSSFHQTLLAAHNGMLLTVLVDIILKDTVSYFPLYNIYGHHTFAYDCMWRCFGPRLIEEEQNQ